MYLRLVIVNEATHHVRLTQTAELIPIKYVIKWQLKFCQNSATKQFRNTARNITEFLETLLDLLFQGFMRFQF